MRRRGKVALVAAVLVATAGVAIAQNAPRHAVPKSADGSLVVALCDGKTTMVVSGKKEGETLTHDEAQSVSDALMAAWRRNNPRAHWDEGALAQNALQPNGARTDTATHGTSAPPAPARAPNAGAASLARADSGSPGVQGQGGAPSGPAPAVQGQVYGGYTDRDERVWMASTQAFIERGKEVFHSATELGGTIGVSCDMCHPNAANTHPESYPKYQVQLGKVALLRDMINWCIENPVRGKPLADDDPKLKAIEAYVLAQRKGVPLDYGKH